MLLEHMQGMKYEFLQRIGSVDGRLENMDGRLKNVEEGLKGLRQDTNQGFEEARQHRQALQEDLEETMRVQNGHTKKLATLSR